MKRVKRTRVGWSLFRGEKDQVWWVSVRKEGAVY